MRAFQIARVLRYLAVPFALLAIWSWLKPAQFPSWFFNVALLLNSCLLATSLWFHIPGSKR